MTISAKPPTRLSFTEQMQGHLTFGEDHYERGAQAGRKGGMKLTLQLTITFSDLDRAISSPDHEAQASGWVRCDALGGKLPVRGTFNLFVGDEPDQKRMVYRIFCRDGVGYPLTLVGVKTMCRRRPGHVWRDTTTLYLRVIQGHAGHPQAGSGAEAEVVASGILHLGLLDFIGQLATSRADAPSLSARLAATFRFGAFFLGRLWRLYGPVGLLERHR